MATLLVAAIFLIAAACAQDSCAGLQPVYVDFHDRNVNNSEHRIQYGLFIGVGTPFQNQSLWPSIRRNETTFSGPNFCDDSGLATCSEQTHGTYKPENSDSFREENFDPLDSTSIRPASVGVMGNDTLNIFTHYFDPSPPNVTHIEDFPVTQLTNYTSDESPWFGPSGVLGLGPSAPILERLREQGEISSRSFGLYVGTAYPRAGGAINGSLTLGGYDSGRFEGDAHNFTLADEYDVEAGATPFRITIQNLVLNDLNNNNETISLTDNSFEAYLTTDQYSMTFPQPITDAFLERTKTDAEPRPNDFSEPTFYLPDDGNFSLTFTLSTGLVVTIPPEELRNISNSSPISAPRTSDAGSSNNSTTASDVPPPGPSPDVTLTRRQISSPASSAALLGTLFLSHLYLTVNYDASPSPAFYLNQALPHGPYVMTEALCRGNAARSPVQAAPVHISSWNRNGTIGALLGGVIGGIALALVAWWAWAVWRRRSRGGDDVEDSDGEEKGSRGLLGGRSREGKRATVTAIFTRGGRKGKSKAANSQISEDARKMSGSSSSNRSNDEAGEEYQMQQFAPIAAPLEYYHPSERFYDPGRRSLSFTASQLDLMQQQLDQAPPPPPPMPAHTQYTYSEPEPSTIGRALTTPPPLHPSTPPQTPPLRSLSPISPLSPRLPTTPQLPPLAFPFPETPSASDLGLEKPNPPFAVGSGSGGLVDVPLSPTASGSSMAYSDGAWTGEARVGRRLRGVEVGIGS